MATVPFAQSPPQHFSGGLSFCKPRRRCRKDAAAGAGARLEDRYTVMVCCNARNQGLAQT